MAVSHQAVCERCAMAESTSVPGPPPLPVEIISHASFWTWLAPPLIAFGSSVVLFSGTLYTLYRTNKAAAQRLEIQLEAAKAERVDERAAKRADQFRDEVASILAERQPLKEAQVGAGFALSQYRINPEHIERVKKFFGSRQERIPQFNKFEQLVI